MKTMRWKLFFHKQIQNPKKNDESGKFAEKFGYKSTNTPPVDFDLKPFEDDLKTLVKNVKFKSSDTNTSINMKMKQDISKIEKDPRLLIEADKTTNHYQIEEQESDKFTTDSITSTYKKANTDLLKEANEEAKQIATFYGIDDRVDIYSNNEAIVKLKDTKPAFKENPSCRLLNPAKPHIGKVSKTVLDRVNESLRKTLNLNQWRSTQDVIKWFSS